LINSLSDINQWLDILQTIHPQEIELGLQRVGEVADVLALRQCSVPVITVAGTNGKGSCVALLEAIYQAAGYRVAAYTSPHLWTFNERVRIHGKVASDAALCHAFAAVEAARRQVSLTYFEFTTLAALWLFKQADIDVIVLEVGLGGRLDAVNVVESDVALISSIDLDHQSWLGESREAIGYEKAGIFRAEKPAVCGDPKPPATIADTANKIAAPLYQRDDAFSFSVQNDTWHWQSGRTQYDNLPIPQLLIQHAASVIMCVELLQSRLAVSVDSVKQGLAAAWLPGRLQWFDQPCPILVDVAHNPAAMTLLAKRIQQSNREGRVIAVIAMLADKAIAESVAPLTPLVDEWHVADLAVPRGASGQVIGEKLTAQGIKKWYNHRSVTTALAQAITDCKMQDCIVVCGSFYTAAQALTFLSKGRQT